MYRDRKWYPESFYLLAMADYLCRENDLPVCQDYDDIRKYKLAEPIYPRDIMVARDMGFVLLSPTCWRHYCVVNLYLLEVGVNAQFSIETEQLAFLIRSEMGEVDSFVIYPNPDIAVLEKLRKSKTRTE